MPCIAWLSWTDAMDDIPREEVVAALDRMVEELLDRAGLEGPPVDAIALAQKHLHMVVCLDQRQQQRGRAQRAGRRPQIYLRPEPTEERHQWSVAREIGEHLRPDLLRRLELESEQAQALTGESLLNLFSSHLLVPTRWFTKDAPACGHDVLALKQRYRTASHEVIALRFLDLPEPCIVTIIDNDHVHRRRSNGPRVHKELTPVELKCQRYVNKYSRPRVVQEEGWTVQGWPVHQSDWKREILRSMVDEDAEQVDAENEPLEN
jgi:Zn-dependent peptidase ImmA (M78 family)